MKRTKDRVRSEKDLKKTQVGFMCERWDFRRGFSIDWSRHKTDLKITRNARGLFAKQPYLLQPTPWDGQKLLRYRNLPWRIKSTGFWAARGLGEMQNGERRSRGSR
jgi:hypothetical protein